MINSSQERRQHPRLKSNIPVKICCEDFDLVTETKDLSCAGTYCRVNKYLEPMTKLKVHLLLPLKKKRGRIIKKVSCQGVIVRVESEPGNNHFNVAIYFNDIPSKERKCLSGYISSLLTNEKMDEY